MSDKRFVDITNELPRPRERRRQRRVQISTAVRIRTVAKGDRSFDDFTTTVNLSPAGLLIETPNASYCRNMKVLVTLPYSESAETPQTEQEGTVVRVHELPRGIRAVAIALKECEENAGVEQARPASQSTGSCAPLVLVLAEENASRQAMKNYLCGEGYDVMACGKTTEARNALEDCVPALVIAEIEGEDTPGYELCAHCKKEPRLKPVPVMLITSSAYPSDYARAHAAGAVVCMAKPYRRERLGHVVRLLAPPPNADFKAMPPHKADASRRAGGHRPRVSPSLAAR